MSHDNPTTTPSNFKTLAEVRSAMLAKLRESDLDVKDAKRLHLAPYTAADVAKQLRQLPRHYAGFRIPYFDVQGRPTKFFRFRYLEYSNGTGFSALTHSRNANGLFTPTKADLRYVQPKDSLPGLYMSPVMDWDDIAKNLETLIVITEGELKAACGCKHGIATLGLGGVWSFKSAAQGMKLLPDFSRIKWEGRDAYICYDSDLHSNPDVAMALRKLSEELLSLGARVWICRLPTLKGMVKTGMDDYITAEGADVFTKNVIGTATEYRACEELYKLNTEVIYVRDPGLILRLENLQRIAPRAFVEHQYSDRVWTEQITSGKGGTKLIDHSAPREWLKWPYRNVVKRITYAPGKPQFTDDEEFNIWPGFQTTPEEGDVSVFRELVHHLLADYPGTDRWIRHLLQFFGYPIAFPGTKLEHSAVIWSVDQGTGKSLLGYTIGNIYGRNFTEISDKTLQSGFNEWAENKQFVMGDEIASSSDKKRDLADRMKSIITQKELRLNPKYVPSYTIPDCINYYFTSNHPDAFFIEDTDRRFFVLEAKRKPLPASFYHEYGKRYSLLGKEGKRTAEERAAVLRELGHVHYYLIHQNFADFNPQGHAPETESKEAMRDAARTKLEREVHRLWETPEQILRVGQVQLHERRLWPVEQITALMMAAVGENNLNPSVLGRKLSAAGFRQAYNGAMLNRLRCRLWILGGTPEEREQIARMNEDQLMRLYNREQNPLKPAHEQNRETSKLYEFTNRWPKDNKQTTKKSVNKDANKS